MQTAATRHADSAFLAVDPRAAEILERVKGVFAAKGFDGASMQDLARAAGMSAGNFYRYFPSKAAIVEAMIVLDLARIEADFAEIMRADSPRAALRATIWRHISEGARKDHPLWTEIEAAAARRPEIAAIRGRINAAIKDYLLRACARIADVTEAEARARFDTEADLLMLLGRGAAIDACAAASGRSAEATQALRLAVMRHIDMILSGIEAVSQARTPTAG
jgi:AcrR family transcriptional regulator